MADHSLGPWDESHENKASQALMFCFDSAFPEKSPCLVVDSFTISTHFCVPECHRKSEIFHSRKCSCFQFPCSPLRGNQRDGGKLFTIAEGTVKVQVGRS